VAGVLVVAAATMFLGFAHKSYCLLGPGGFDALRYRAYCYSDIPPLYRRTGLIDGEIPYLEGRNEYPVGTGLIMWAGARLGRGEGSFLLGNALILSIFGLVTAGLLARLVGDRALYFAAAPTLALYAFLNWDLVPVALSTAGLYAFLRGRDARSGAWLGLGAAAKVYPALLVVPLALDRLRSGRTRRAWALVASAAAVWLALNVPVALAAFERWSEFFRFSSARDPTWGTLWYTACRPLTGSPGCGAVAAVNAASAAGFLVLAVLVGWLRWRREPAFPRWLLGFPVLVAFLLTAKVYSPQYSLWLLPWFALVLPDLRVFLAFEAVDLSVFLAELSYLGAGRGGGLPALLLGAAVLARAGVLGWLLVAFVRGRVRAPALDAQALTSTSPSSSS
jgi:uncharacterized membrane protein